MSQVIVTFQLEHVRNMCAIASILVSPTDPFEADATNYIVKVDGSDIDVRSESSSSKWTTTLVYESSCGAHNITIAANNTCGRSPDTYVMALDPERRFVLNVNTYKTNCANSLQSKLY